MFKFSVMFLTLSIGLLFSEAPQREVQKTEEVRTEVQEEKSQTARAETMDCKCNSSCACNAGNLSSCGCGSMCSCGCGKP